MNATKIDWVRNPDGTQGYTWNPITGCLNGCPYCYARKLANGRLKKKYLANEDLAPYNRIRNFRQGNRNPLLDPFYPRFWEDKLGEPIEHPTPMRPAKRKGIFPCDMSDLFGIGIPDTWTEQVMTTIKLCPYHRFYLLTKQPQNLNKWSPFPENCWIGVTAADSIMFAAAYYHLANISAKVKYISIEPLLDWDERATKAMVYQAAQGGVNWVIIGQQTPVRPATMPKAEWVEDIIVACIEAKIPIWLKDNLVKALPPAIPFYVPPLETPAKGEVKMPYRQEIPS